MYYASPRKYFEKEKREPIYKIIFPKVDGMV